MISTSVINNIVTGLILQNPSSVLQTQECFRSFLDTVPEGCLILQVLIDVLVEDLLD